MNRFVRKDNEYNPALYNQNHERNIDDTHTCVRSFQRRSNSIESNRTAEIRPRNVVFVPFTAHWRCRVIPIVFRPRKRTKKNITEKRTTAIEMATANSPLRALTKHIHRHCLIEIWGKNYKLKNKTKATNSF